MIPLNNDYSDRFHIVHKASLRPEKIVFYTQFIKKSKDNDNAVVQLNDKNKDFVKSIGIALISQPKSNKHDFEISQKASGRIREKITWLYHLSKNQTITTHNGKKLFNFKMNFITLTLPSKQKHTTDVITKECLNQFITECSQKFGLKNYVWRLEFQKNGNAHYHIATDCYIEYWKCKKIWNRIINKLGYVDHYCSKFSKYSFQDYYKEFHKQGQEDYKILKGRFDMGTNTKWCEPNTVDCKNVTSSKNIAWYISKYITKKSDASLNSIVAVRENLESNLRLWFCSRSLSRLSKVEIFLEKVSSVTDDIFSKLKNVKEYVYDYCQVIYFDTKEQETIVKQSLWCLFQNYARENRYYSTV